MFFPQLSYGYYNRGLAYGLNAQWNLALADLNQAIQLNPNDQKYYKARSIIYHALGKKTLATLDEQTSQDLGGQ